MIVNKLSSVAKEVENNTDDIILDTGVSCDGTWQRRDFSSNNGVFTAISLENGKVLDVEPMSKYCKGCMQKNDLQKKDLTAYAHWRNPHTCKFNYNDTAGGMETEGEKQVFTRSIDKHKVRYVDYLGDGDSKSYVNVKKAYEGIEIKKLECVGHYQKRVETSLRNLKKIEKGLGGRGRLTDATIDLPQNFAGVAIRQNKGNLKRMKSNFLASLFHVASSKDNNFHIHCPTGEESWSKFNSDGANYTSTYKPVPGLPRDIIYKIRPIYEDLSKESELEKCLHGERQNANESFNGMI